MSLKKSVPASPAGVEEHRNVISEGLPEPQATNLAADAQSSASESEASEPEVPTDDGDFEATFKLLLNEVKAGATDPEDEDEVKAIFDELLEETKPEESDPEDEEEIAAVLARLLEEARKKSTGNDGKKQPAAGITPAELVTALTAEGTQYFSNTKNEPVVLLPNDPHNKYWPAGHERIVGLLHSLHHQLSKGGHLKSNVLTTTMALIKEECYAGPRLLTEIESPEVEKDPIVPAIIEFVTKETNEKTPRCQGLLKDLFKAVTAFRDKHGLLYCGYFPPTTSIFSRCLSRLIPALRELGIKVARTHEEDGSHYEMTRLPHFQNEPDALSLQSSGKPSVGSPKKGRDYEPADGSDAEERMETEDAPLITGAVAAEAGTTAANKILNQKGGVA